MGKVPSKKKKITADGKTKTAPDHLALADEPFSESVIESLPGLFWVLDDRGRYVRWNKNLESALGYSAEELAHQHANFLVHPDDRPAVLKAIERCLRDGQVSIEYELVAKSGLQIPYAGSARSVKLGNSVYMIGLAVDISARKEAEDALRKALLEIEQLREQLHSDYTYLKEEIKLDHGFDQIIGQSDSLKYVLFKVNQIASTETTVLILGETGTGKELIARAIHDASPRKDRPLVKLNCATLHPGLIESELFGHERGAFTGALSRQSGRFEVANGTTLFLDEIGELPPELQGKLLRVLQEGEFERLGSARTIKVDVRIIAATNRDLEDDVEKRRFREDLWYRLNVFPITVPPLRERRDDISLLVHSFVNRLGKKLGKTIKTIPQRAIRELQEYPWPGNVRELENVIERAVINTQGSSLRLADRLEKTRAPTSEEEQARTLEEMERTHITKTLEKTYWKVSGADGAAVLLGLNPNTLRGRMRKLGIRRPPAKQ
jgi:PAS domain S-box-containing protein